MRNFRNRDALLVGAAVVLGCAMSSTRGNGSDADAQTCTISSVQLARASERTLYEVVERVCPAVERTRRTGREIRVHLVRGGELHTTLGNATALRTLHPRDVARVRFIPSPGGALAAIAIVTVELREP